MLVLKNIKKVYELGKPGDKNYQSVEALKGVNISFRDTEFVAILGPSGCGKTTLLNIVGGLDQYTDGDLIINDISTKEYKDKDWDNYRNHKIGFVFQSYNLIPHQTVVENVELALTLSGVSREERRKKAIEALNKVGLNDKLHVKPSQLSGGQMQRVAIARAIVNDPDIILADEPTGALDTKTSVQIMDLLKEISKEKLIIMVTHNPDLAAEYSTRIVKLLDGRVTDDTQPFNHLDNPNSILLNKKEKASEEKTSMSFGTALSLSGKNLLTKKGRTALVSFAGSIGIIGISLILSLSNGFQLYIDKIQEDTLSTYPLTVSNSSMDYSGIMEMMMGNSDDYYDVDDTGKVIPNNVMSKIVSRVLLNSNTNDLKNFKKYIENNPEEFSDFTMKYSYNITMDIYDSDDNMRLNPTTVFTDLIANVIKEYNKHNNTSMNPDMIVNQLGTLNASVYSEMLDNQKLLESQYDMLAIDKGAHWPTNYNECVLSIDSNYSLDDYNLYALGLTKTPTLEELANQIVVTEGKYEIETQPISYEQVLNKTYRLLLPTDYFELQEDGTYIDYTNEIKDNDEFNEKREIFINKQLTTSGVGIDLKIVGIVKPKENVAATSISTAVGYTSALTREYIKRNNESEIMKKQLENKTIDVISGQPFAEEKTVDEMREYLKEAFNEMAVEDIKQILLMMGTPESMIPQDETTLRLMMIAQVTNLNDDMVKVFYKNLTSQNTYDGNITKFNQVDIDSPTSISFYVSDFKSKEVLKGKISDYNEYVKNDANLGEGYMITYTDYVGIMMSSISTIIKSISYVLIAFVGVSLVVSSIMIGIITYISVLERTKEIGVLRSIGASKKDIRNVFTAESLIIGLISGLIGIGVTMLLNIPISILINYLSGIANVAQLPIIGAILLVLLSCILTLIAGSIPSKIASKKDPVIALRSE